MLKCERPLVLLSSSEKTCLLTFSFRFWEFPLLSRQQALRYLDWTKFIMAMKSLVKKHVNQLPCNVYYRRAVSGRSFKLRRLPDNVISLRIFFF